MIHLISFADDNMRRARQLCLDSGMDHGADSASGWSPETSQGLPDADFLFQRPEDHRRALGWWSWKPAIIQEAMASLLGDGDILIYADAGIEFIDSVRYIIDRMDQDIFLFGNNWEHLHWCKRSVIEVIWPVKGIRDVEVRNKYTEMRFGKQCQASVVFFRVSDYSRAFVKEWLEWCLFDNGSLIDDSPSWIGNHPEFREHRHDQAILTTMAYREGIRLHYWPASYNDGQFVYPKLPEYASDDYPALFNHHRRRDHEWSANMTIRYDNLSKEQVDALDAHFNATR